MPCTLVAALLLSMGCYSTEVVSMDGLRERKGKVDITLFMKDSLQYEFAGGTYRFESDTLSGYGIRRRKGIAEVLPDVSVNLSQSDVIETRDFDVVKTILLCGGIGIGGVVIYAVLFGQSQPPTMVVPYGVATVETSH